MRTYRLPASRGYRVAGTVLRGFCLSALFCQTPKISVAANPLPPPTSAHEVQERIRAQPLDAKSWPAWKFTPTALAGSKQLKDQKYVVVRGDFREQLKADPKNVAAARMLAMTLV